MTDINEIMEPSLFWMWNQTPTPGEICRQLDGFLSKGVRSLYIHPMPHNFRPADFYQGMELEYLSPEFFELISIACQEMQKRGMILWLYDEGGWPSGCANGAVVGQNPQWGIWTLCLKNQTIQPRQYQPECNYPDLMNPDATNCFIKTTHEKYDKAIGEHFGRTVKGIFTDEPRIFGRIGTDVIPWSPCLPAAFESDHAYPLDSVLKYLFVPPAKEDIMRYHRAYLHSVSKLVAEHFYKPIRQWCDRRNLLFEGHLNDESDFDKHGFCFGDFFQQAKYFHCPGIDTIKRQIFPDSKRGNFALLASSVKWLEGRCAALTETGGVYGAGLTLAQMKWLAMYQMIRGIDRINFIGAMYASNSARCNGACGDFSLLNPQMRDYDLLASLIRQIHGIAGSTTPLIRAAVYYRSEMIHEPSQGKRFNAAHEALLETLLNQQIGVVLVDLEHLKQAKITGGELAVSSLHLAVLIVHTASLPEPEECGVFHKLLADGLSLVYIGSKSQQKAFCERLEVSDSSVIHWAESSDEIRRPELSAITLVEPVDGIRVSAWQTNEEFKLLIFNQDLEDKTISFTVPHAPAGTALTEIMLEDVPYSLCAPLTLSNGVYQLHLYPADVRAFHLTKKHKVIPQRMVKTVRYPLEQSWQIYQAESYIINDEIQVDMSLRPGVTHSLGDYSIHHRSFSGTLHYTTVLNWTLENYDKVFLDLGKVYYIAEVTVNSKPCGRRAWEPFVFDITDALCRGSNQLAIRVTNTLANQWTEPAVRSHALANYRNSYLETVQGYLDESCHCGLCGPIEAIVWRH